MPGTRRLISNEIWRNEKFGGLSDQGRLLFIGCFCCADDDGILKASPKYLKALVFPYDDKTSDDVSKYREECIEAGLLHLYSNNGTDYVYCKGWSEHQSIRNDRYVPSVHPKPECHHTLNHNCDNQMTTSRQPSDNQVTTKCQTDVIPVVTSNTIQYNTIQYIRAKLSEVFEQLDKIRNYRPPKRAAEAASIRRMLKTYSVKQIIDTYNHMKSDKFWLDKELFMMSVESQIGAITNGAHKKSSTGSKKNGENKYGTIVKQ